VHAATVGVTVERGINARINCGAADVCAQEDVGKFHGKRSALVGECFSYSQIEIGEWRLHPDSIAVHASIKKVKFNTPIFFQRKSVERTHLPSESRCAETSIAERTEIMVVKNVDIGGAGKPICNRQRGGEHEVVRVVGAEIFCARIIHMRGIVLMRYLRKHILHVHVSDAGAENFPEDVRELKVVAELRAEIGIANGECEGIDEI